MNPHSTSRIARPHLILAATVMALLATLAPLSTAEAKPKPPPAGRAQQVAATKDGLDLSATMPNSTRDDVTGDFLGRGYEQRMRVENGQLNIYDAEAKGGTLLQQTPTDLVPNTGPTYYDLNGDGQEVDQFSAWTSVRFQDGGGYPRLFRDTYHLNSVFLAAIDGNLFIAGTKGSSIYASGVGSDYQSLVYKVSFDGKCARQACATAVVSLNTMFSATDPSTGNYDTRSVAVTQLAAGYAGGIPYLAVGQSDYGLSIYDINLNGISSFGEMEIPGDPVAQTAVTALAWDPAGQAAGSKGLLAIGIMDWGWIGYLVTINSNGTVDTWDAYTASGGRLYSQIPLSAAIGRRPNETPVVAFGLSNFTVQVVDASQTTGTPLATGTLAGGGIAVNGVPRLDDSGGTDWAVVSAGATVGTGVGQMFRDTGSFTLQAQPLAVNAQGDQVTQTADLPSYRSWFPGYKQGRFALTNTSAEEVTVQLESDTPSGSGCWFSPAGDPDALPAGGVVLEPGQTSQYYTLGAYTAGINEGGCSTTPGVEAAGAWRGYLSITPTNRPADTRLVNVQLKRNWTVDAASDQTGGSITLTQAATPDATPSGAAKLPYGYQTFTVDGPAAPVATAAPTLAIHQVGGPVRTKTAGVYRVDVGASTWTLTGSTAAAPQIQAVLPPFRVQGLYNGTWSDVGGFLPLGKLSAKNSTAANGVLTSTVTVSGGTFFWENTWGTATPYTKLQVVVGTGAGAPTPNTVTLAGAPTYGPPETIAQMNLTAPGGNATPVPNGVDASQVQVAVSAISGGANLPPSDPAYKSIFYRADDGSLITNLYPVVGCPNPGPPICYNYDSFIGVQPSVTAYPIGGGQTATRRSSLSSYDYVSTTLTSAEGTESITGYVGLSSAPLATPAALTVGAGTAVPSSTLAGGQDGRNGFSVEGCADFSSGGTCVLPSITNPNNLGSTTTQPALYQAGSTQNHAGPLLGMLMKTQAQTANALPMIWTSNYAPKLARSVVNPPTSAYTVRLQAPNNFPAYTGTSSTITPQVDATLVSHGVSVTLRVPVPPPSTSAGAKSKKGRR